MTRCWFHDWGKWSAPYGGHAGNPTQQRRCLNCNRAQQRGVAGLTLQNVPPKLAHENSDIICAEPVQKGNRG